MLPISISKAGGLKVLCLGAHCDDIEIGCGGTILKWADERRIDELRWTVFTSTTDREAEARNSAQAFLERVPKKEIEILKFRDRYLPQEAERVKQHFEEIKRVYQPDVVFTHYRHDLHQDHRTVCDLTWNAFRNHLILEYEIPKYDGDLGNPGMFVQLARACATEKVELLMRHFPTQAGKHWFDEELFFGLMRLRGMSAAAPEKYAEGFYVRKAVL